MTTETFPAPANADPASGTAAIAPVTSDMMDHAAHAAAEQAEAVAHEAARAPAEPRDAAPAAGEAPLSPDRVTPAVEVAPAADGTSAAAVSTVAQDETGPPNAADLAFTHGTGRRDRPGARARAAAGPLDGVGLLGSKLLEMTAANLIAAGHFASALLATRTVPEAAAVNAEHMRRAFDTLTAQSRELMLLGQKAVFDAARAHEDTPRKP